MGRRGRGRGREEGTLDDEGNKRTINIVMKEKTNINYHYNYSFTFLKICSQCSRGDEQII